MDIICDFMKDIYDIYICGGIIVYMSECVCVWKDNMLYLYTSVGSRDEDDGHLACCDDDALRILLCDVALCCPLHYCCGVAVLRC